MVSDVTVYNAFGIISPQIYFTVRVAWGKGGEGEREVNVRREMALACFHVPKANVEKIFTSLLAA